MHEYSDGYKLTFTSSNIGVLDSVSSSFCFSKKLSVPVVYGKPTDGYYCIQIDQGMISKLEYWDSFDFAATGFKTGTKKKWGFDINTSGGA